VLVALRRHLSRFLQVGAIGFTIDAGLLWFLVYQVGMPPIVSRGISFLVTISVTFIFNAHYTFEVSAKESSMTRYMLVQSIGALINFSSYSWLVLSGPLANRPLLALVVGSFLATVWNFAMVRQFVFKNASGPSETQPNHD
jgi:putative flippase GtrA